MNLVKVNKEPIEITYFPDEDDRYNYEASFVLNGFRYWLKDFIRIKNSPWVREDFFPAYIDAFQSNEYHCPLYISLLNDTELDVYMQRGDDS